MLVPEVDEGASDWNCFTGIHEKCADFRLGSGRHDVFNRSCKDQKWTVELGAIFGAEEVKSTGAAPCFGSDKVCGVAMDVEYHVACAVSDFGVGVACGIV